MRIWHKQLLNLWFKLTTGSTNRKIFGAAITVGLGTALVKIVAVSKELVVAWKFGTTDELDAFFIAYITPSFVINVIGASFQAALIPTYIQVAEQEGKKAAEKLFSGVIICACLLLSFTSILMVVTAPVYLPFITKGFEVSKFKLTLKLLYTISPLVLLNGISLIWGGILNARERFALAAVSPIITPTVICILLLCFDYWGSFAIVIGLISGAALEIIVLGIGLKKQGISLFPKWGGFTPHLSQVFNQYGPTVAGSLLMCSNNIIDQSMAAMLSPGSVAAINYAEKVVVLPIFLTTTALSTAVVPFFSQMVVKEDWTGLRHTLSRYLSLIFMVTVPLTISLIFLSKLIVQLLLQRGSFTANDTQLVADILTCYAFQIPFYLAGMIFVKLIISMRLNYLLVWGSVLNLIMNVTGNYLFMRLLGVKGIALSTSFVITCSCFYLFLCSRNHLRKKIQNLQVK